MQITGFLLVAVALAALPWLAGMLGNSWVRVVNIALLYVMLALGLNIVVGFAGLLDLGYIAFYAVGAYVYGLLASLLLGSRVRLGARTLGFDTDAIDRPERSHPFEHVPITLACRDKASGSKDAILLVDNSRDMKILVSIHAAHNAACRALSANGHLGSPG